MREICKSKSEGKKIDKENIKYLLSLKAPHRSSTHVNFIHLSSFQLHRVKVLSKCGYKLFNSLFTDVYASVSSAKIAFFTETLWNLTALNCSLRCFVGSWHTLRFSLVFCNFWVSILASFLQGGHFQAAVVTYPKLQI